MTKRKQCVEGMRGYHWRNAGLDIRDDRRGDPFVTVWECPSCGAERLETYRPDCRRLYGRSTR